MSTAILRNMSVAPKTSISHQGAGMGTRLIVELPVPLAESTPEAILALLGKRTRRRRNLPAEHELHQVIEATIGALDLPSAMPVKQDVDVPPDRVRTCADLATIVAILAKSSDRLYLRDKEPILSGVRSGRRVVLVLPDTHEENCR